MTPCARSHSIPGSHTPPCTCTRECPDHEGHCTGCAPVEATRGLLCGRCSQRMRDNLGASEGLDPDNPVHGLPWAWEHLADAYPSLSNGPAGTGGGSGPADPEAQRLAEVLSVRDGIHDKLASWVGMLVDQSTLTGPDLTMPVVSTADTFFGRAPLVRIQAPQRILVRRYAAWLLDQIESLEAHEAVAEAWQELADLMSRAHALAPWRSAPTQIKGIPCRCGALALHDHGTEVTCWVCRANYDRQHYRAMTVVFAARFADDPRALREHERGRLESSRAGFGGRP